MCRGGAQQDSAHEQGTNDITQVLASLTAWNWYRKWGHSSLEVMLSAKGFRWLTGLFSTLLLN